MQAQTDKAGDLTLLSVPIAGSSTSDLAIAKVRELRDTYIPQAFAGSPAKVYVTGDTAFNVDYIDIVNAYFPWVIALVLALSFVLLMLAFRSVVVPATAIVMNLLSVGAAYGLITLVFQHGVGASIFGFQQVAAIEQWVPLFLFSVLFGLSMDYQVFLLSRIKEEYDRTGDNRRAVSQGIGVTAGIITGAALIMVAVFAGFASGKLVMFEQMGFGLGVADPARRDARAHAAGALGDEPVRQVELVPAALARVAAASEHREHAAAVARRDGCGRQRGPRGCWRPPRPPAGPRSRPKPSPGSGGIGIGGGCRRGSPPIAAAAAVVRDPSCDACVPFPRAIRHRVHDGRRASGASASTWRRRGRAPRGGAHRPRCRGGRAGAAGTSATVLEWMEADHRRPDQVAAMMAWIERHAPAVVAVDAPQDYKRSGRRAAGSRSPSVATAPAAPSSTSLRPRAPRPPHPPVPGPLQRGGGRRRGASGRLDGGRLRLLPALAPRRLRDPRRRGHARHAGRSAGRDRGVSRTERSPLCSAACRPTRRPGPGSVCGS